MKSLISGCVKSTVCEEDETGHDMYHAKLKHNHIQIKNHVPEGKKEPCVNVHIQTC